MRRTMPVAFINCSSNAFRFVLVPKLLFAYAGEICREETRPVTRTGRVSFIEILSKYGGRRGLFRALHRQADAAALLVDIQNGDLDDIAD